MSQGDLELRAEIREAMINSPSMTLVTPPRKKRALDDFESSLKRRLVATVDAVDAATASTVLTTERADRVEQLCREALGEDR